MKYCGVLSLKDDEDSGLSQIYCMNQHIASVNLSSIMSVHYETALSQLLRGKTISLFGIRCKILSFNSGYYEAMLLETVFGTQVRVRNKTTVTEFLSQAIPHTLGLQDKSISVVRKFKTECVVIMDYGTYILQYDLIKRCINTYTFDELYDAVTPEFRSADITDYRKGVIRVFKSAIALRRFRPDTYEYGIYMFDEPVGDIDMSGITNEVQLLRALRKKDYSYKNMVFHFESLSKDGVVIRNVLTGSTINITEYKTPLDFMETFIGGKFKVEDLEFNITGIDEGCLYINFKGVDARLSIRATDTEFNKRSLKSLRYILHREHNLIDYQVYSYMTGIVTGICRYAWTSIDLFGQTVCKLPKTHIGTANVRKALIGKVIDIGGIPFLIVNIQNNHVILFSDLLKCDIRIDEFDTKEDLFRKVISAIPLGVDASEKERLLKLSKRGELNGEDTIAKEGVFENLFTRKDLDASLLLLNELSKLDFSEQDLWSARYAKTVNRDEAKQSHSFKMRVEISRVARHRQLEKQAERQRASEHYLDRIYIETVQDRLYGGGYQVFNTQAQICDAINEYYNRDMGFSFGESKVY